MSVIIPTFNRAEIVTRAIDSVLAQSFEDFELLVIDDASVDETESVVRSYEDPRVTYICHEENSGNGGVARNTGIANAKGEYVAFLDDDDRWLPQKLERQVETFSGCSDRVGLVYCWMNYYDGDEIIKRVHPRLRGDIFREMLDRNAITNASTLMTRMDVLDEIGGFDPEIPRGIDSDWIRRVSQQYLVEVVPEVLVEYNVGHEFDRDSDWDESGLRAAIESTKMKFDRFEEAFERYPSKKASNLAYIGGCHALLGEIRLSARYFSKAFDVDPFEPRIYFEAGKIAKFFVDRNIPRLGREIDKHLKG